MVGKLFSPVVGLAGILLASSFASAAVTFTTPSISGQTRVTTQEWQGFTTASGSNAPTSFTNTAGSPVWVDSTASTNSFGSLLLGVSGGRGRIYNPVDTLHPQIDVGLPSSPGVDYVQIVLQAAILNGGNLLDPASFAAKVNGNSYLPASVVQTSVDGGTNILFTANWTVPASSALTLYYAPVGSSSSQVGARVDTFVPEPAALNLLGLGGFLLRRRSIKA